MRDALVDLRWIRSDESTAPIIEYSRMTGVLVVTLRPSFPPQRWP